MTEDPWRVVLRPSARKDLRRLDPPIRERLITALERLERDGPRAGELVKLKGRPESRLRVGDWRAIVELDQGERIVRVKRVLPRGRVYDR